MNAMQSLNAPFSMEARANMARHNLPPEAYEQVRASLAHRSYLEEVEPIVQQIISATRFAMPSYVRHEDGHFEVAGDGLTDEMREIVNRCQGWIDEIKARYDRMMAS